MTWTTISGCMLLTVTSSAGCSLAGTLSLAVSDGDCRGIFFYLSSSRLFYLFYFLFCLSASFAFGLWCFFSVFRTGSILCLKHRIFCMASCFLLFFCFSTVSKTLHQGIIERYYGCTGSFCFSCFLASQDCVHYFQGNNWENRPVEIGLWTVGILLCRVACTNNKHNKLI